MNQPLPTQQENSRLLSRRKQDPGPSLGDLVVPVVETRDLRLVLTEHVDPTGRIDVHRVGGAEERLRKDVELAPVESGQGLRR